MNPKLEEPKPPTEETPSLLNPGQILVQKETAELMDQLRSGKRLAPVRLLSPITPSQRAAQREMKQRADQEAAAPQKKIDNQIRKIGLDPEDVYRMAQVMPLLAESRGGLDEVILALRFSEDPIIIAFLEQYNTGSRKQREEIPWEAWMLKGNIDPAQFLGAAILALRNVSMERVKILAVTSHPEVLQARITGALKPGGYRDRNALDTALKFLPSNKGVTIINTPPATVAHTQPQGERVVDANDLDPNDLFPALGETQKLLED